MTDNLDDADGIHIQIAVQDGKLHVRADADRGNAHAMKFAPEVLRAAADQIERERKPLITLLPRAGTKVDVANLRSFALPEKTLTAERPLAKPASASSLPRLVRATILVISCRVTATVRSETALGSLPARNAGRL